MTARQASLEGVGGRIPTARVVLAPGEYVTARQMAGAPATRLMVLVSSPSTAEAAPHNGGTAVTVCLRGGCESSAAAAAKCARQSGAWHPIPAPAAEGLF